MNSLMCGSYRLSLGRPLVMGIVNLTPDSFSGDGRPGFAAIEHARQQLEAGADMLDIGAESSRPGADPVSLNEELARLKPVLAEVTGWGVPISIDTYKPEVMRFALHEGVSIINDIAALRQLGAMAAVAASDCAICLMHMQGEPRNMQASPHYQDVVEEVEGFLNNRVAACEAAGIARNRLMLDPGFGFGKTLEHNLELFRGMGRLHEINLPLLVGVSRKRMLGDLTGQAVEQRMAASVVAAVMAAEQGAQIIRVHDVAATKDGLAVWSALRNNARK
jgi:dihydropteroate synthase